MGIQINEGKFQGWRAKLLGFLLIPALIYLDLVCNALGYVLEAEIEDATK